MSRPSTKDFFVKERLAEAREARNITQTDLAKALQRSPSTLSNWERGEQAPEPASLEQLARALGVSTGYFLMAPAYLACAPRYFRVSER